MSSIQERLQLKRVPLDTWNIREKLCLASAVVRSGDQNWMSVSRALRTIGEHNRPGDWYSQKSCAAQYGALLENVETPKRKKRSSEGAVETPQESILKKLTQERIAEIQKNVQEMNQQYEQLKNEILEVSNPNTSEDRLRELWSGVEAAKRARERESARRAAWLREREEKRARIERAWRPTTQTQGQAGDGQASPLRGTPSSPLLSSLLKSSPVVTTPQIITHPANVVETVSPSATAPTLSMLLERPGGMVSTTAPQLPQTTVTSAHDNKHAAIEHIKSQLVQIEHQLKANASPAPPPPPAVDIDDIEIKAEDVYAFSDIDLVIPPVTTMHKGNNRLTDKPYYKKETEDIPSVEVGETSNIIQSDITEAAKKLEAVEASITPRPAPEEPLAAPEAPSVLQEPEVKIAFPEVKFPTLEIKVIQPDEERIKQEEIKEPEAAPVSVVPETAAVVSSVTENVIQEVYLKEKEHQGDGDKESENETNVPTEETTSATETKATEESLVPVVEAESEEIHVPEASESVGEHPEEVKENDDSLEESQRTEPEIEAPTAVEPQIQEEAIVEDKETQIQKQPDEVAVKEEDRITVENMKKEISEESVSLKEIVKDANVEAVVGEVKEEKPAEPEEVHTETDDDTPMELSREEDKEGKTKRDYSRKKKPDSRTCSGSESAEAPESPSSCDAEKHRLWKKSVLLVYSRLCAHKYASLFLRPITDEEAPGYSGSVKRPMDLGTIKKNIESGAIRTTAEFHRDILLMLSNALMYNSSGHSVHQMARDMFDETVHEVGVLLAAQAHAGLGGSSSRSLPSPATRDTRKRRRHDSPSTPAHQPRKRHRDH